MSAADSRATSGVFIRPIWRRVPGRGELAIALVLSLMPLVGLLCLTVKIGDLEGEALSPSKAKAGKTAPKGRSPARVALAALSAPRPAAAPAASAGPGAASGTAPSAASKTSPSVFARFALGRRTMNSSLGCALVSLRAQAADVPAHVWVWVVMLILLGPVFCFFAWPLRRAATALLGAYFFGSAAFEIARLCGMNWAGSLVISLAPAFLGALVGWHLLVAYTTVLSGSILGAAVTLGIVVNFGAPSWLPVPVILLLCTSLAIALVYLLALRPALISGWATLGAGLMSAALIVGLGVLVQRLPLWDLFMACFALLVILGTVTQYRLTGGEEGETDLAAEAADTDEGKAMLRRLRLEHEGAE